MLTQTYQDNFKICGYKVPQYFWFMISGSLCDVFQAIVDYMISIVYTLEWEKPTVCWTLSYMASICIRHYSHSMIVFGEYSGTYCSSLMRTYATYSSSIVISMITNHMLTSMFKFSHQHAWIITMLWTGVYNYFMLKKSWKLGGVATDKDKSIVNSSSNNSNSGVGNNGDMMGNTSMTGSMMGGVGGALSSPISASLTHGEKALLLDDHVA